MRKDTITVDINLNQIDQKMFNEIYDYGLEHDKFSLEFNNLYVQCGKAEWGYFIDVVGDSRTDFKNIDIVLNKNNAMKIARITANKHNVPLITDWGYKKDGGYFYADDITDKER